MSINSDANSIEIKRIAMTEQQRKFTESKNPLKLYRELVTGGETSFLYFIAYEIFTLLFRNLNGLPGMACRSIFYRCLFKNFGGGSVIAAGVSIRRPYKISIGKKVIIDESAVLDVRGNDSSITIGNNVTIGRNTIITAKNAHIKIDDGANIGTCCRIATQSKIEIGKSVLIAAFSYVGPGNHRQNDETTPLIESGMEIKGGVIVGDQAWIGAHTTILDGVAIGNAAIIGAHSLVNANVPDKAKAFGVPAKVKN